MAAGVAPSGLFERSGTAFAPARIGRGASLLGVAALSLNSLVFSPKKVVFCRKGFWKRYV
jgi:hypothetical protein